MDIQKFVIISKWRSVSNFFNGWKIKNSSRQIEKFFIVLWIQSTGQMLENRFFFLANEYFIFIRRDEKRTVSMNSRRGVVIILIVLNGQFRKCKEFWKSLKKMNFHLANWIQFSTYTLSPLYFGEKNFS